MQRGAPAQSQCECEKPEDSSALRGVRKCSVPHSLEAGRGRLRPGGPAEGARRLRVTLIVVTVSRAHTNVRTQHVGRGEHVLLPNIRNISKMQKRVTKSKK